MQVDVVELVKKCDECQRFGNVQWLPAERLTTITSLWPFAQWGIDIIGPMPQGKGQVKFLLIAINYFIKWVEAEALATITEVIIPVEVGVSSIRRKVWHEEDNDDQLRINLDCLDEVRDKASSRMTKHQQKMAEYYNKRVKLKRLDIGDLILRKVTTATRDSTQGKLGPIWEGPYRVVHYSR